MIGLKLKKRKNKIKILVCPDIHGSHNWRNAKKLINNYDKVIILGDEFDSWTNKWPDQINNANSLIKFKCEYKDKVDLLWSNHAISYYLDERCSGYQYNHEIDIKEFYNKFKDLYQAVSIYDNWIFSHAGISKEWLKCLGIDSDITKINQLFKERPNFFRFVGPESSGRNEKEGPLWIRPGALRQTMIENFNQVVGHTELVDNENTKPPVELLSKINNKDRLVLIDSRKHDCLIELDTITNKIEKIN